MPGAERRWQLAADGSDCGGLVLFPLAIPPEERARFAALLSEGEAAHGKRFLSSRHGERYVVAHGRLRQLLAPLLGMDARTIEFAAGADGKPHLAGTAAASNLQFNLSHSAGLGLIGWSWQRDIGVDVEVWRTMRDAAALVKRYFSSVEVASWEGLSPELREQAFFNLWTRKEAYVKALGRGLSLPLHSFDVSHENGSGAQLLRKSVLAADDRPWSLAAPESGGGVSLAVVLQAETLQVSPLD